MFLERKADRAEVGRMLRLGIDADRTPDLASTLLCELDHLVERRDIELPIKGVRAEGEPLARAERLDLREREVLGEPPTDHLPVDSRAPLAVGELRRDIGGTADLVLMPYDEHAVLRRNEIGLDVVGPHLDQAGTT